METCTCSKGYVGSVIVGINRAINEMHDDEEDDNKLDEEIDRDIDKEIQKAIAVEDYERASELKALKYKE